MENFFFGKAGLIPWIGIVERRNSDDLRIGRCKVRAFFHHSGDTSEMSTDSLPDAYPLEPLTGTFWATAKEGDTVFGYFLDEKKQSMLIVGKLPVALQNEVNHPEGSGFKDARTSAELASFPRQIFKTYRYSPNGVDAQELDKAAKYPPYGSDKASIPFLSRADEAAIPSQISPDSRKAQASGTRYNTADGKTWFELPTVWSAKYPFNHAYESESLHVMEFDDSPGSERVSLHHRIGSGFEFFPDGSVVYKNMKDGYEVTLGNKKIGISGDCDVHIKGNRTLLIDGNLTQHVSGDYFLSVDGQMKTLIRGNETRNIGADSKTSIQGDFVNKVAGQLWLQGSKIQENSSSTPDVDEIHDFDLPSLPANTIENTSKLISITGTEVAAHDDTFKVAGGGSGEVVTTNKLTPAPTTCPVVKDSTTAFTDGDSRYRMQLSKYYQLADLTIRPPYPHAIADQNGLSQADIICNLAALSLQIIDPISAQFPGSQINSGFRALTDGKSQHESGEAVDLQWPSITAGSLSKYLEIANWIKDNLPFDQLILEHGTTCWIHVSMSRTKTNRKVTLTQINGTYYPGLSMFGRI